MAVVLVLHRDGAARAWMRGAEKASRVPSPAAPGFETWELVYQRGCYTTAIRQMACKRNERKVPKTGRSPSHAQPLRRDSVRHEPQRLGRRGSLGKGYAALGRSASPRLAAALQPAALRCALKCLGCGSPGWRRQPKPGKKRGGSQLVAWASTVPGGEDISKSLSRCPQST